MKKGLIFTLDAAIAVTVLVIILVNSSYYFSTSSKESISQLQLVKLGSDIITLMGYTGELQAVVFEDLKRPAGLNGTISNTTLNYTKYLPPNYNMRIEISDLKESLVNSSTAFNLSGAVCDNWGCSAGTSGGTFSVNSFWVDTADTYIFLMNLTNLSFTSGGEGSFFVKEPVTGNQLPIYPAIPAIQNGMYNLFTTMNFQRGINQLEFTSANMKLHWFKVLGVKAYYGSTHEAPPNATFVGTGERVIFTNKNSTADNMNLVRYSVWLK